MPSTLIRDLAQIIQVRDSAPPLLRGAAMSELPSLSDAFLLIENGVVQAFGPMSACPDRADEVVDGRGRCLLPAWVDAHTHIVFAGSREAEFVDRIRGLSYEDITRRGGGIMHSALRLRECPEAQLYDESMARIAQVQRMGTGAIEIKSGYGLDVASELKMLRVVRRIKETAGMPVRATFLGAHVVPLEYRERRADYLRLLIEDLLPRVAGEGLADYVDVFCEKVAFSAAETDAILAAAAKFGLRPKIHTNQFNSMGGIEVALRHGALSVDHLEVLDDRELALLAQHDAIACLLPTAPFFLNDPHRPPARQLLEAGVPVALASDYNPGSTPSGNMNFVFSLACIQLRMTPEEALNAATVNAAHALGWGDTLGHIRIGGAANLLLTEPVPSLAFLPYSFGRPVVEKVWIDGKMR